MDIHARRGKDVYRRDDDDDDDDEGGENSKQRRKRGLSFACMETIRRAKVEVLRLLGRVPNYSRVAVNGDIEKAEPPLPISSPQPPPGCGEGEGGKKEPVEPTKKKAEDFSHLNLKKTSWASAKRITKSILPYFWPRHDLGLRLRVLFCLSTIVIARIINICTPLLYEDIIDDLPEKFPLYSLVMYGVLSLVARSLTDVRDTVFQNVSQEATRSLSLQTFAHIHKLSLSFHLSKRTGTLLKIVDKGTNSVTTLLTLMLFNILPTILELIVVCVVLAVMYGMWLSFVAFASSVSYVVFTLLMTEWRTKFRRAANLKEHETNDICVDSLTNFETIKYFTAESHEAGRYDKALKDFFDVSLKSRNSLTLLNFGQGAITQVAVSVAMIISAYMVHKGADIGDVVAVNAYIMQLFTPLGWLGTSYRLIMQSFTDMEKLIELLDTEPEVKETPNAPSLSLSTSPSVEFRDVKFNYGETSLLSGISFSVPAGKSVALVGQSGSGKTTIFRLLCRFYDPQEGQILINGQDIKTVSQESLRGAIGVVPQDTVLFNDTIKYNIGFGNRLASFDDIVSAAKGAQVYDFVMRTPEQWQTIVGERGLRLSGGEKQRVAIARTILKNPPILVLDEATSALDSKTEKDIQTALQEVSKGRTTLVIAHRLSTIVNCDEILVIRNGTIRERGTHQDLLSLNGEYAGMWYQQLKQEQELVSVSGGGGNGGGGGGGRAGILPLPPPPIHKKIDPHAGLTSPDSDALPPSNSLPEPPPSTDQNHIHHHYHHHHHSSNGNGNGNGNGSLNGPSADPPEG